MNKWIAPVCTLGLALLVAIMSASPGLKQVFHTHGVLHPWLHLGVFAALSFSAVFCAESSFVRLLLLFIAVAFGWGTEFREHLVDGLPIERFDIALDTMGVVLGGMAGWLVSGASKMRQRSSSDKSPA